MNKMFVEYLPKKEGIGINKGKLTIDWKSSIGYKISFKYLNINGEIEIVGYNAEKQSLSVKYGDNDTYEISCANFIKCKLGRVLGIITNNFKVKIGETFKDEKRNIIIIDKKFEHGENKSKDRKKYKYQCNICNYEGWIEESNLLQHKKGCACCANQVVVEGINDIPTTAPFMVKFFQGGYNEAKKYTRTSHQSIYPICPDCGRIKDKEMKISNIYNNKSIGCSCSDSIKYPEKVMVSILSQLNVKFIFQLNKSHIDWISDKVRYDFYIPSLNIIIETHGKQHYEDCSWSKVKDVQENDNYKKELAIKNAIKEENYIIIDCRYSDLEWIKNNILNSKLNNMFDLSNINWNKCEEFALSNLIKEVCELKKNNIRLTASKIADIINVSNTTIRTYLKKGAKLGWCDYDSKEEMSLNCIRNNKKHNIPVMCLENGIIFYGGVNECSDVSEDIFNVKLEKLGIAKVCRGERKQYKGYTFKYV